ncbi:DUF4034 domain-containing protein [Stenotrophomonas sp. CFBP 13718]|uniref:DUF4034 domain-containing protein n=1 Tax=Stenotrophomonas sp. CFBP 13718 TaxID=2775304 RepID=UPI00177CA627|nr:DUF4034 domain-containing protein [Stenotrophomonas sp. CFBP 13718]MBD8696658.1 DUF4034 domain-containing protein [Stenotrophomonas sp. CFBP 13718]
MDRNVLLCLLLLAACALFIAPCQANESAERTAIKETVYSLMDARDFDALEALAERYRQPDERTSSGTWKLEHFYNGVNAYLGYKRTAAWAPRIAFVDAWIKHSPDAPTPHIAKGILLLNRAFQYRGGGFARTVKEENWAPFRENVDLARAHLMKHKTQAARDPHWYHRMLEVARLQDWSYGQFDALFDEGTARHPRYYGLYFSATEALLPKWGGSAGRIEDFAQQTVRRTRATEGTSLYARIYWVAINTQFDMDFPGNSRVDWPTMSRSMDDVLQQYPAEWNIQNFAYFSCLAGDREKTAALVRRMREPADMDAWPSQEAYQECRDWAVRTRLKTATALR